MKFHLKLTFVLLLSVSLQSQARKVLLIGDSHMVGSFGEALHRQLAVDNEVIRYGGKEAKAAHFIENDSEKRMVTLGAVLIFLGKPQVYKPGERVALPRLNSVLLREKPDAVVISLGDWMAEYKQYANMKLEVYAKKIITEEKERLLKLNMQNVDLIIKNQMTRLKEMVVASGSRCIVVTPPLAMKSNLKVNQRVMDVSTLIWETMRPECAVINTSKDIQNRTPSWKSSDGMIFEGESGREWALAAAPAIQQAMTEPNGKPPKEIQYAYPKGVKDLTVTPATPYKIGLPAPAPAPSSPENK